MSIAERIKSRFGAGKSQIQKRRPLPIALGVVAAALMIGIACSDQLPTEAQPEAKSLRLNVSSGDGPKIATDKQDYALGETVSIEGWDWTPGETVRLQVLHTDEQGDNELPSHQPWEVIADSTGYITATWDIAPDGDEGGASLVLTAEGLTSLAHAEVTFTDLIGIVWLYSDSYGGTSQRAFAWGSTIYPQVRGAQTSTCYRFTWKDPSNATIGSPTTTLAASSTLNAPTFSVPSASGTYSLVVDQLPGGSCSGTFVSPSDPIYFDVARAVVIGAGTTGSDATGGDQCVYLGSAPTGPGCASGTATTTWVRSWSLGNARTFIRFDLTGALPAGASVTGAKVRLTNAGTAASARNYEIQRADATWSEGTISWATQPGVTGVVNTAPMATALVPGAGGGELQTWVKWSVDVDVQGFVSGSLTNNGWRIRDASEGGTLVTGRFHATETTAACPGVGTCKTSWPVLLIDYTTVVPDNTSIATLIHKWDPSIDIDSAGVTTVALGSTVHDKATVSNTGGGSGNGTPLGTIAFTFWTDGTCGTSGGSSSSAGASVAVNGSGIAHPSDSKGPLAAGSYSFKAAFTSGDASKWNNSVGSCEPLTVEKATPVLTTAIHKTDHSVVPDSSYIYQGTHVHDSGALTGSVGAFSFTGTITYSFYANGACSGTAAATSSALALPGGAESGAFPGTGQPLVPGQYSYKAAYSGNTNYNGDTSDCEPFTVVPYSSVTGGGLCTFDRRADVTGQQFNAIFTPEAAATTSKLNATNPGQFRYNVFYIPSNGTGTININIPAGFVTQGATPVHVYAAVAPATNGDVTCFTPSSERKALQLTTTDSDGGVLAVDVTGLGLPTPKVIYITVHLDYYWKGVAAGCTKQPTGTNPILEHANCTTPSGLALNSLTNYTFTTNLGADFNKTIQNFNVFKKDPGIGGLVLRIGSGDPVYNALVDVYQGTKKVGSVRTDEDGWYMWVYKYTGKAVSFTVNLPAYNQTQSVTLKSNGYGILNFNVP